MCVCEGEEKRGRGREGREEKEEPASGDTCLLIPSLGLSHVTRYTNTVIITYLEMSS